MFCGAAAAADKKAVVIPLMTKAGPVDSAYTVQPEEFTPYGATSNHWLMVFGDSPYRTHYLQNTGSVTQYFYAGVHLPDEALIDPSIYGEALLLPAPSL
ncbi:MAG: hypothetical protein CSA34_07700 [Desulfobulbus propionicus]|nr:MAG: hypothetical protein CSA34_07700 [Desulfobulbus propionicus]